MLRRSLVAAALAGLLALVPAAAAVAAAPDTDPLRAAGWRVTWGSHGERASLRAGASVSVRVAPIRGATRRQRAVRVTLVRLGGNGRPRRTVASAKLRRGLFRVRLPQGGGTRYALIVRVGRRTLRERIATARSRAPVPRPSAPIPTPPPAPVDRCAHPAGATRSAAVAFDRPSATWGESLKLTTVNDGQICLWGGYGSSWERLVDSAWQPVRTPPYPVPAIAIAVWPGTSFTEHDLIENPTIMPPGRYRAVKQWSAAGETVTRYAYLDVLPGPNGGPAAGRCGEPDDTAAATATLDRTTATHDEQLALTITNTGPVCLMGSDIRYRIDRYLPDGSTESVLTSTALLTDRGVVVQPGGSHVLRFAVGNFVTMPAGRYRISYDLWVPPASDAVVIRTVHADFDVVAPPAG